MADIPTTEAERRSFLAGFLPWASKAMEERAQRAWCPVVSSLKGYEHLQKVMLIREASGADLHFLSALALRHDGTETRSMVITGGTLEEIHQFLTYSTAIDMVYTALEKLNAPAD